MRGFFRYGALFLTTFVVVGCTTVPQFALNRDSSSPAPSGPKAAALIANLKCELWSAVHDMSILPVYEDTPSLTEKHFANTPDDRLFNLKNIFQEIDYVGEAQFTLDVKDTSAVNPSLNFINPYTSTTNLTLSVGGQLSDVPHRTLNLYSSVDTARLIESPPSSFYQQSAVPVAKTVPSKVDPSKDPVPCNGGSELGGELGLREVIATSLIAARMNDITAFPSPKEDSSAKDSPTAANVAPVPDKFSNFVFGQIATQIDFTINEGINGGPAWTLKKFKGPGGSSGSPFMNINRQVTDTLVVTFLPVCIREKYFPKRWDPSNVHPDPADPYNQLFDNSAPKKLEYPMEYKPEMGVGTPGWANYLPPCSSLAGSLAKTSAPAKAQLNNYAVQSQGLVQQGPAQPAIP